MADIVIFDPELVIARLTAEAAVLLKVGGAADFPGAMEDLKNKIPAAYVIPLRDAGSPSSAWPTIQRVGVGFAVALAVRNLRDPRGQAANETLRPVRLAVWTALLGWQPGIDYEPCEFAQGRLLQLADGVLWWQDEFRTGLQARSV